MVVGISDSGLPKTARKRGQLSISVRQGSQGRVQAEADEATDLTGVPVVPPKKRKQKKAAAAEGSKRTRLT